MNKKLDNMVARSSVLERQELFHQKKIMLANVTLEIFLDMKDF